MKSLSLSLVAACAAVVIGCGSTTRQASSPPVSTVPPESSCSSYLGGGVAVAMCNNKVAQGSQPLSITLHRPGARSGSAPGFAQAMGDALRDGESFEIGPTPDGAELLAKFDIRPRRALATAVFRIPASVRGQEVEAEVSVNGDDVDTDLRLGSGERVPATYIYVPAGH